ncbi:uncharacterized protein LOC128956503 [Oppia nitens]|uniref:uncharacterized protein LOC128956503 n=1 Tax=Oppia nitens TaxID=1686743 RepID=UPI0023DA1FF2|nr:uncharacterized protein LOC128956503 [Oppia nitens]
MAANGGDGNDNNNNDNNIQLNVDPHELTIQTNDGSNSGNDGNSLMRQSLGGYTINNTLETNSIRGNLYHDLRLESRTQQVLIDGHSDVHLDSRGGDIQSQSYDNTVLTANQAIIMSTKSVELKNLLMFDKYVDDMDLIDTYQLCICESGQLFAVPPDSVCKSDAHWCTVRVDGQ